MTSWLIPLVVAVLTAVTTVSVTLLTLSRQRETEERTAQRSSEQRTKELLERYQEPLVRAAFELQSRLYNLLCLDLLSEEHRRPGGTDYAVGSTAWLFGQYFGWVEIIRREAQFLPVAERGDPASTQDALLKVSRVCSSDRSEHGSGFQLYRSDQRAMGELMIVDGRDATGQPRSDCLGYAAFVRRLRDDADFAEWFALVLDPIQDMRRGEQDLERLRGLQHALIDLLDIIDRGRSRYATDRERIPAA